MGGGGSRKGKQLSEAKRSEHGTSENEKDFIMARVGKGCRQGWQVRASSCGL